MKYKLTALIKFGESALIDAEGEIDGELITYSKKEGYLAVRFNNNSQDFNNSFTYHLNSMIDMMNGKNYEALCKISPCE